MKRASIYTLAGMIAASGGLSLALSMGTRMKSDAGDAPPPAGQAQTTAARGDRAADTKGVTAAPYQLLARAERELFKAGEPLLLKATLRNNSRESVYVVVTGSVIDNKIEVKDGRGRPVPLSEAGRKLLDSAEITKRLLHEIPAGREVTYDINVGELYQLAAGGEYAITIKRDILKSDKKPSLELASNPVEVKVTR